MSIAPEHIEAIRQRADILEVIGNHVTLRKSGRRHVGLCPFHQEKTPSFSVAADKNVYHCFGCGVGGDVFDFVMRHDGVDFQTAARTLGRACGVALEPESPQLVEQRRAQEKLAQVNKHAAALFTHTLWSPQGQAAQAYLKSRDIQAKSARTWGLGMGPPGPVAIAYFEKLGIGRDALVEAGLLSEDGQHLLAAGRLMFPIYDVDGRVAGFGGRRLHDDPASPKYVNSRDSLLFKKSALLFGLFEGMRHIRREKSVIIVEGYTDVMAAYECGLTQAVAALGTAFTPAHAQTLKRLAEVAVVLLDADAAGLKAAHKASMALLQAGLKVNVAPLPAGEDPDSLRRKQGPRALQQSVAGALPALEFFMQRAFAKRTMSVEERVAAAQELGPMLGCLTSGLERELYAQRLADHVGVTTDQLLKHLRTQAPQPRVKIAAQPRATSPQQAGGHANAAPQQQAAEAQAYGSLAPADRASEAELHCLRELLLYPTLRARFGELADFARSVHMGNLLEALAQSCESAAKIIESHVPDIKWRERLLLVTQGDHSALDGENDKANRTFEDVLARLKAQHLADAMLEIDKELEVLQHRGDTGDATDALLRRKRELIVKEKALRCVDRRTKKRAVGS